MLKNTYKSYPNEKGYFGQFGGRYVSETLMPLILEVEKEYEKIKNDKNFFNEFNHYLKTYVGRPSPLFFAERITEDLGGAKIYFKRDELNHTGAHKINNCMGQILLAKKMGKTRIIAETGAGQHGVATATVCALFGLPCIVSNSGGTPESIGENGIIVKENDPKELVKSIIEIFKKYKSYSRKSYVFANNFQSNKKIKEYLNAI